LFVEGVKVLDFGIGNGARRDGVLNRAAELQGEIGLLVVAQLDFKGLAPFLAATRRGTLDGVAAGDPEAIRRGI
jgi:hypothetical protein